MRHLVSLRDWSREEIWESLELSLHLKRELKAGVSHQLLAGKTLGMIFQKPSLRTRVSFEVGMNQLGGRALYLGPEEIKLGERETVEDVARVLSRYVDGLMARVFGHEIVEELAKYAGVPVINGLSDLEHPCQILGDMLTIYEKKRRLEGLKLVFIGDGNNVAHSWLAGGPKLGMNVTITCPKGYEPEEEFVRYAQSQGPKVEVSHAPQEAVREADVLYTDVWASMGQEAELERRRRDFQGFQINERLIALAKPDCLVMHCLPAHYGEEITYEAAHSENSAIYDQAENRLHAQKGVLALLLG